MSSEVTVKSGDAVEVITSSMILRGEVTSPSTRDEMVLQVYVPIYIRQWQDMGGGKQRPELATINNTTFTKEELVEQVDTFLNINVRAIGGEDCSGYRRTIAGNLIHLIYTLLRIKDPQAIPYAQEGKVPGVGFTMIDVPDSPDSDSPHASVSEAKKEVHDRYPRVKGVCPSCGSDGTLFLGEGGYVTCGLIGRDGCKQPSMAADIMEKKWIGISKSSQASAPSHRPDFADFVEPYCKGWISRRENPGGDNDPDLFQHLLMDAYKNSGSQRAVEVAKTLEGLVDS